MTRKVGTLKDILKAASAVFVVVGVVFLTLFGYLSEIFPRIVPDWAYYIITPAGTAIVVPGGPS